MVQKARMNKNNFIESQLVKQLDGTSILNILVSVIMPAYNSELYIEQSIKSVLSQSHSNFELIVIDDFSTDKTISIVESLKLMDNRITLVKFDKNSGAAVARNSGIEKSKGSYIAFIDSDDLWHNDKLALQLRLMIKNGFNFTCTGYSKINEKGEDINFYVGTKKIRTYNDLLFNSPGNSTVMYNSEILGKTFIPDIRKRNDYIMWLRIIRKAKFLYGFDLPLAFYRVRKSSLSYKKVDLIKYHWMVYRKFENLSIFKSVLLIIYYIYKTVFNSIRSSILLATKKSKI